MLTNKKTDIVLDNPFYQVGLSREILTNKTVPEATALARAALKVYLDSAHVDKKIKQKLSVAFDQLNNPMLTAEFLREITRHSSADFEALHTQKKIVLHNEQEQINRNTLKYLIGRAKPTSHQNFSNLAPAKLTIVDIVSLFQSPINCNEPLACKLFLKTINCTGNSCLVGGANYQSTLPYQKKSLGLVHIEAKDSPITYSQVRDCLHTLGLVNDHSMLLNDFAHKGAANSTYSISHPIYSHFHHATALDRLLLFHNESISGQFASHSLRPSDKHCSLLISAITTDQINMICIEGVLLKAEPANTKRRNPKK